VTTTAVALEHGTIPEGERVLLLLGSANRDPARFRDPDRFDPSRTGRRHLAFGYGIHHCVGSILARLTARAVLERLCVLAREVALDGPATRIFSSLGEREFARLPLRFTPR
jgi:cytochrome P450